MRRVVSAAIGVMLAVMAVGAQSGYLFTLAASASDSARIRVTDASGDGYVLVEAVRALPRVPIEVPEAPTGGGVLCDYHTMPGLEPSTYVRSQALTDAGLAAKAGIVRRNAAGDPDPNGKTVTLGAGMSSFNIALARMVNLHKDDPLKAPGSLLVNGAKTRMTATEWSIPNGPAWVNADGKLAAQGATPAQVAVFVIMLTESYPHENAGVGMTEAQVRAIVSLAVARYPNLRLVYLLGHPFTGFARGTSADEYRLRAPEPYVHEDSLLLARLSTEQGFPVPVSFIDTWSNGPTPNPTTGFSWPCVRVNQTDGLHPSETAPDPNDSGKAALAVYVIARLKSDPWLQGVLYQ